MTEEAAEYLIKKDWEGEVRTQSEIIVIARLLGAFEGYIDFLLVPNPETITPQPKSSKDPLGSVMGEKRQLLAHQIIKRWQPLFGSGCFPDARFMADLIDEYIRIDEQGLLSEILTGRAFEDVPNWLILHHLCEVARVYYSKHR